MIKRVLIFVSILFVAILVVGCTNNKIVEEFKEAHKEVLANKEGFAMLSNDFYVSELSEDQVNKFFDFIEKIVANSKLIDNDDFYDYVDKASDEDSGTLALQNLKADKTKVNFLGIRLKGNKMFVLISYVGDEKFTFYEVANATKYKKEFEDLIQSLSSK